MFFRGSSALRNVARRAGEVFEELGHPRLYGEEKSGDLVGSGLVAEFAQNSATFGLPSPFVVRGEAGDIACFWQSSS